MSKVKICGITNLEDAQVAAAAGADLLGFIFYEPSPRYVSPEVVREIVGQVVLSREVEGTGSRGAGGQRGKATEDTQYTARNTMPLFVGVFVNEPVEAIEHILDYCKLDAAQLHGDEPPKVVAHFAGRGYKALRPKSMQDAEKSMSNYQLVMNKSISVERPQSLTTPAPPLPDLLLDACHPRLYGGTGHVTDWEMAADVAREHNIMLAGSLTPDNVAKAIAAVRPWGVDVSSGVEREKGKKNHGKVRALIEAVRSIEG